MLPPDEWVDVNITATEMARETAEANDHRYTPPRCPKCDRDDKVFEQIGQPWCDRCVGFLVNLQPTGKCKGCGQEGPINIWKECPKCASEWES